MYEFIRGIHVSSGIDYAVIDAGGVGYRLGISHNCSIALPPRGEEACLFVHFHVTENSQTLYGFIDHQERSLFEILIGVNKIGPRVALNILSTLTVSEIVSAVTQERPALFTSVSGVGAKTASRLVLELQDKLDMELMGTSLSPSTNEHVEQEGASEYTLEDEAYTGLIALGFTDGQIKKALERMRQSDTVCETVEECITKALQVI
ncbi:Holliday junction branch migration protein RuvA [Chitinivibrio alkaliphilus]|uniref:Holliday junction branch migration complex subunit RuvA n=1 Tax=Chitinivibrio alkaliphilus ACht1 TaxID=1313304 RepID=U7DA95_9BACT|nr:Holliday junction branch migration protein RuvA [Chitinivibrio alkaliphilus]ERP32052.1 Holliday junction DNA helicase RuvA [Chitinivibrio alkaliphilus ACht1]